MSINSIKSSGMQDQLVRNEPNQSTVASKQPEAQQPAQPASKDAAFADKAVSFLKNQPSALSTNKQNFSAKEVTQDEYGMTHVKTQQSFNGVKVTGGEMIVHFDKNGKVDSTSGKAIDIPKDFNTYPRLSSEDAIKLAKKSFGRETSEAPKTELTIISNPKTNQPELAYKVTTKNLDFNNPSSKEFFINAKTGQIISQVETLHSLAQDVHQRIEIAKSGGVDLTSSSGQTNQSAKAGSADLSNPFGSLKDVLGSMLGRKPKPGVSVVGSGESAGAGTVQFNEVKNSNGTFSLKDLQRGGSQVFDAQNAEPGRFQQIGKAVTSNTQDLGSSNKTAVSAAYNTSLVWDFLKDTFGRNSIDNKGFALNSSIHVGKDFGNAFWNGSFMSYGDGDGKELGSLVNALDVAGHEIAHGMTEKTAGLVYEGQSGGINEAMSDIMGTAVEFYAAKKNPNIQGNYQIGETVYTPGVSGDALRYMDHPGKDAINDKNGNVIKLIPDPGGDPNKDKVVRFGDPDYNSPKAYALKSIDHASQYVDGMDVHFSSGLVNNAFYLLAEGGKNDTSKVSVQGIGRDDALKVFYRALTTYMVPNTDFKGAQQATLKAAKDIFGADSTQYQRVKDSWHAVGVD